MYCILLNLLHIYLSAIFRRFHYILMKWTERHSHTHARTWMRVRKEEKKLCEREKCRQRVIVTTIPHIQFLNVIMEYT